jgi:hypothetical protein
MKFKPFKSFNRYASFNPPFFIFPRSRGKKEMGGWNDLSNLNVLNPTMPAYSSANTWSVFLAA